MKSSLVKYIKVLLLCTFVSFSSANAQSYYYFQDSPGDEYYDFSWMELSEPSELERMGADNRKFPVETGITPQQGFNCLRLNWRSLSDGNWNAIAAGLNWTDKDISDTDTLVFFLRSEVLLEPTLLPSIFMEDITNKKSNFHPIGDWTAVLEAGTWTRIKIPMATFFDANDGTDWTKIKTIGFTQNASDGAEHTLYIDDMRVVKGTTTAPPAAAPTGILAKGYDSHYEVCWDLNPESGLQGYRIEKSTDGGESFQVSAIVDAEKSIYIDWTGSSAAENTIFRVRAINASNEPSPPSETAEATTREFTDDELLDMVQEYTFRYFWDFGHPVSGLSRERNTSGNTVTSGGSGFGLMAIITGIERNFISREEGAERMLTILEFLESADRFHGAWSHWLHGETGKVIPFSTYDNGGDIVETAFMAQGLLTVRQYFQESNETEQAIVALASELWEGIEWDWYRRNDSQSIYWHWSPNYEWQMNMTVRGWNEAAIVYLLAIASPTHSVPASLWETGWAGGSYYNPRTYYDQKLYVGHGMGGPMFFAHYSFLGFDPNNIADSYTNYFDQNRHHALVQQAYSKANPKGFTGYSDECWGITASDDPDGYLAHEPNTDRDNGTISPTAALGSFPYTPAASMKALKHFYRNLGDRIWGEMGFKDAFNETRNWYADSYLAIDQGPIIVMIENYRSNLHWDLFMSNPEIVPMMNAIGFIASANSITRNKYPEDINIYPNPSSKGPRIEVGLDKPADIILTVYDITGKEVTGSFARKNAEPGLVVFDLAEENFGNGMHIATIQINDDATITKKIIINQIR